MRHFILCIILLFFAHFISAQDRNYQIYGANQGIGEGPVTTETMTERLVQSAQEYFLYDVPRIAEYNYCFGHNQEEHRKLNGYGVLLVSSVNKVRAEHPIRRLYFISPFGEQELQLLFAREVEVEQPIIQRTFGKNRVDYYYLLPYSITQQKGFLVVDWAINREGFVLIEFPLVADLGYQPETGLEVPFSQINWHAMGNMIKREFNEDIENW